MAQTVAEMYGDSADILSVWMEKLFPIQNQGCINFGYWKDIKKPLTKKKRIESQKRLYFELFDRFEPPCKTVLEVGCGRGHGVAWLIEREYEASRIDALPSQIEKSKNAYPSLAPRYHVGKAEQIPFNDSNFDCICSLAAAQHFTSFKKFCQESFRVLKRNGKLVVSTYFLNNIAFVKDLEKIIPNNLEGFHNALSVADAINSMELSILLFLHEAEYLKRELRHSWTSKGRQESGGMNE